MNLWLDTNVLVRLASKTPEALFQRALALVERMEASRERLAVHPLHVAEATYVLRSSYGYSREQVRDDLGVVLRLRALEVWDEDRVLRALELMVSRNVDFDDAYLALWAAERGDGVASFDGDFARLPVHWQAP